MDRPKPFDTRIAALGTVAALFILLWLDLFLPPGRDAGPVSGAVWLGSAALRNALRFLALCAFVKMTGRKSGFAPLRPPDGAWAFCIAASLLAAAFVAAGIGLAFGARNPLFGSGGGGGLFAGGRGHGAGFLLAAAGSSLAVGYAEEFFFRLFAQDVLVGAGLPAGAVVGGLSLLFGASHGAQGVLGAAAATGLALILASFRRAGRSAHALCLGHALYDFIVLTLAA